MSIKNLPERDAMPEPECSGLAPYEPPRIQSVRLSEEAAEALT